MIDNIDGFALVVAALLVAFVHFGEHYKNIVYLGIAIIFAGILGLRFGDELFYIATGFTIVMLAVRMFRMVSGTDSLAESESED